MANKFNSYGGSGQDLDVTNGTVDIFGKSLKFVGSVPGDFVTIDANGELQSSASPPGVGPGGSVTQLQYNLDGVNFGGMAGVTWTSGTNTLTLSPAGPIIATVTAA